jgi:hypothetical protein
MRRVVESVCGAARAAGQEEVWRAARTDRTVVVVAAAGRWIAVHDTSAEELGELASLAQALSRIGPVVETEVSSEMCRLVLHDGGQRVDAHASGAHGDAELWAARLGILAARLRAAWATAGADPQTVAQAVGDVLGWAEDGALARVEDLGPNVGPRRYFRGIPRFPEKIARHLGSLDMGLLRGYEFAPPRPVAGDT